MSGYRAGRYGTGMYGIPSLARDWDTFVRLPDMIWVAARIVESAGEGAKLRISSFAVVRGSSEECLRPPR